MGIPQAVDGSELRQRKNISDVQKAQPNNGHTKAPDKTNGKDEKDHKVHVEFGGPWGTFAVMAFSHVTPLYMLVSLNRHDGFMFSPDRSDLDWLLQNAWPTREAVTLYMLFLAVQLVLGYIAPGVVVPGNPLEKTFEIVQGRTGDGQIVLKKMPFQLKYLCNSFVAWWLSLGGLFYLQHSGTFDLGRIYDIWGPLLTVAMITGNLVSLLTYLAAYRFQVTERMLDNFVYDFFMGAALNPRIAISDLFRFETWKIVLFGSHVKPDSNATDTYHAVDVSLTVPSTKVRRIVIPDGGSEVLLYPKEIVATQPGTDMDLKLWAEIKMSWLILFTLVLGAVVKERHALGYTSNGMWIIVLAQGLYSNACMKGEHFVPVSWDITYEKWGWMLIYWNLAGVPFVYCFQSFCITYKSMKYNGACDIPTPQALAIGALLVLMWYMWETSNHQKCFLRMWQQGRYIARNVFPVFPPYKLWDAVPGRSPEAKAKDAANREKARANWQKWSLEWLFNMLTSTARDFGAIVKDDYERVLCPAIYDTEGVQQFDIDPATGLCTKPKTSDLLCDGWYKYVRKPHYVSDWVMTIIWGLSTIGCGFTVLPFFYSIFFGVMIYHRWTRDEKHLSVKYGEAYSRDFKNRVKYAFIPKIY